MSEPAQTTRQSHVGQEVETLGRSIIKLESYIDDLTNRLESILNDSNPKSDKEGRAESQLVPLASVIRDKRRIIDNANHRLGELLERIEL